MSTTVKEAPKVGASFKYKDLHGIVTQSVETIFDYIDSKKLIGYPVYNVVVLLEENKQQTNNELF